MSAFNCCIAIKSSCIWLCFNRLVDGVVYVVNNQLMINVRGCWNFEGPPENPNSDINKVYIYRSKMGSFGR